MSNSAKKRFTAADAFNFFNNQDEEGLKIIKQQMNEDSQDWLETPEGLCICVQESNSHIGLYVDAAGGLGFGGVVRSFEKENPTPPPIQIQQSGEVIHVDFVNKKVLSRE